MSTLNVESILHRRRAASAEDIASQKYKPILAWACWIIMKSEILFCINCAEFLCWRIPRSNHCEYFRSLAIYMLMVECRIKAAQRQF